MIGYLEGSLIWSDRSHIIISVNGSGYEVTFKNNFTFSDYNSDLKIFITHKISEYGEALYGFQSMTEKQIFEILDSIKGVGSKVIYTIIAELEIKTYSHLQDLKLEELVKLPGVGKSTAQKFLLGLSNKLKKELNLDEIGGELEGKSIEEKFKNEIELLVEWGIKKPSLLLYLKDNFDTLAASDSKTIIQKILKDLGK